MGVPGIRNLVRHQLAQRCFSCESFEEIKLCKSVRFHCWQADRRVKLFETRPSPKWCPRRENDEERQDKGNSAKTKGRG